MAERTLSHTHTHAHALNLAPAFPLLTPLPL